VEGGLASLRNYSLKTIKILFAESGNKCAYPDCPVPVISRAEIGSEITVTGEICHISPASSLGPRGKSELSRKGINDPSNLIVLCPTHHAIVDSQLSTYTEEVLKSWKSSQLALNSASKSGNLIEVSRLPSTNESLLGRTTEIAQLDDAWRSKKLNVVSVVALGGLGKSALVNHWLAIRNVENRQHIRVFGWSFYAQGTTRDVVSSNEFIESALIWFNEPKPLDGDEADKGRRLATLIRAQPTILILDGIESLQLAPGPNGGELVDPGLKSLLTSLASDNQGLCIVTTRYHIPDLDRFGPSVKEIRLDGLRDSDGAKLLQTMGVIGDQASLESAVSEYRGHPLALRLLATFLRDVHGGAIERRIDIPLRDWDKEQGGEARRIMDSYRRWLGEGSALQILRMLGLFDRPAEAAALSALRQHPPISGLTDHASDSLSWAAQLSRLRKAGLISPETPERTGALDTHPLIREFFGAGLHDENPNAWLEGHRRLFEHLKTSTPKHPDTLSNLFPLFSAIYHGCKAAQHKEALQDIYIKRIQRGRSTWYSTKRFGIPSQHLAALSCFFETDRVNVCPNLNDADKLYVLMETAYELRALGHLRDSIAPLMKARDQGSQLRRLREWASAVDNLSETYLYMGNIASAVAFADETVSVARKSGKAFEMMFSHCTLANALHFAGRMEEAAQHFAAAEVIQAARQPETPRLKSLNGTQYCDFMISTGSAGMAVARGREILERLGKAEDTVISSAICSVVLARALIKSDTTAIEEAGQLIRRASEILRSTGQKQELALALISRVALMSAASSAERDELKLAAMEAYEIAQRSGSDVLRFEACNARWKLYFDEGDDESAKKCAVEAIKLRHNMGYARPSICGFECSLS
jgi:tetratricopeptide (TPR) repeat protein